MRHYVDLVGRGLVGISPKDGKVLWTYNLAGGEANIPTPIVRGDYVYCCSSYGTGTVLLKLSPDGRRRQGQQGLSPFRQRRPEPRRPVGAGGRLRLHRHGRLLGRPHLHRVSHRQGHVEGRKQNGRGVAGLTSADGKLIFRAESGEVSLIEASPERYNLISSFKPDDGSKGSEPHWSHPVVSHGLLLIRQHDVLLAYDLRKK